MAIHRLDNLSADEVSLVPKAANRRVFLLRKGDIPMAFDEVKALQTLEKLDAQGDGELIEALAAADDPTLAEQVAKAGAKCTAEEMKRLKAAMRVMGPDLAKKFNFQPPVDPDAAAEGDEEDAEAEGETEKKKKGKLPFPGAKAPFEAKKADEEPLAKADEPVVLPPDVVERLAKADAATVELKKAQDEVATLRHEKERGAYITKAAGITDALPNATADDMGGILLKTSKALTKDEQDKLEMVLKSANEVIKKSDLFKEFGSALGDGDTDPFAQVKAMAEDLRKHDSKLTPEGARAKVLKEHPELMTAINKAQDERVRKARG